MWAGLCVEFSCHASNSEGRTLSFRFEVCTSLFRFFNIFIKDGSIFRFSIWHLVSWNKCRSRISRGLNVQYNYIQPIKEYIVLFVGGKTTGTTTTERMSFLWWVILQFIVRSIKCKRKMAIITSPTLNQVFSLATKVVQIVLGSCSYSLFSLQLTFLFHMSVFFFFCFCVMFP